MSTARHTIGRGRRISLSIHRSPAPQFVFHSTISRHLRHAAPINSRGHNERPATESTPSVKLCIPKGAVNYIFRSPQRYTSSFPFRLRSVSPIPVVARAFSSIRFVVIYLICLLPPAPPAGRPAVFQRRTDAPSTTAQIYVLLHWCSSNNRGVVNNLSRPPRPGAADVQHPSNCRGDGISRPSAAAATATGTKHNDIVARWWWWLLFWFVRKKREGRNQLQAMVNSLVSS